ncbi:hypothetical protein ACO22_02673 [Paracoccidioides brasiliensis]|uniref:Uncharacterized protein n=1 Tax=Paracoccidioides brasiliensis TaxID=121759 RepID=A0A1D2JI31_PARBR|nr:hypothetical protein ACO22_02673 [Paracoccidioides brasiliensis]
MPAIHFNSLHSQISDSTVTGSTGGKSYAPAASGEQVYQSSTPLSSVLDNHVSRSGIANSDNVTLLRNKLPSTSRDQYITGIRGSYQENHNTKVNYEIRHDSDPQKGNHVNARVTRTMAGKYGVIEETTKLAVLNTSHPSQADFDDIITNLNNLSYLGQGTDDTQKAKAVRDAWTGLSRNK